MKLATDVFQDCKYLFLHSIGEPDEGGLRLIVHEARVGGPPTAEELAAETLSAVRTILEGARAIEHGPGCDVFEIAWDQYIAYAVDNESYALPEPKESIGTGRVFIEYTKSAYLDYLAKVSFASEDYPGPFKHWKLLCLDHIVNVVSTNEPTIKVTRAV
jgi:hypothetical protein